MAVSRYSRAAITLHWLMAALIIGNLAGGFLHDYVPSEGGARATVMGLHRSFGVVVLVLGLARIGWRLANPPPPLPHYFTRGERLLSGTAHLAFYLMMLVMPLTGWAMADRNDRPLSFFLFGPFEVTKLGVGKAAGEIAHEAHEVLGWVMLATLALHILAIIKHAVLDRDNLLVRMGVGRGRGRNG
jgi:cytochrome b561